MAVFIVFLIYDEEIQKGDCLKKIFSLEPHTFFSCVNTTEVEKSVGARYRWRIGEMFKGESVFKI